MLRVDCYIFFLTHLFPHLVICMQVKSEFFACSRVGMKEVLVWSPILKTANTKCFSKQINIRSFIHSLPFFCWWLRKLLKSVNIVRSFVCSFLVVACNPFTTCNTFAKSSSRLKTINMWSKISCVLLRIAKCFQDRHINDGRTDGWSDRKQVNGLNTPKHTQFVWRKLLRSHLETTF